MSDAFNPLGPGEADSRSPAIVSETASAAPLGPGDDDPRSPAQGAARPAVPPAAPGDGDPHDGRIMLAPQPAGPGGTDTGPRHVTHIPAPVHETSPLADTASAEIESESPSRERRNPGVLDVPAQEPVNAADMTSDVHEEIT